MASATKFDIENWRISSFGNIHNGRFNVVPVLMLYTRFNWDTKFRLDILSQPEDTGF